MKLTDIKFTEAKLSQYFNLYFCDDLQRYFDLESYEGIDYISANNRNHNYWSPVQRNRKPSLWEILQSEGKNDNHILVEDGNLEDELMFVGILSALFYSQEILFWTFVDNKVVLSRFFKSMRFPLILEAVSRSKDFTRSKLEGFLTNCSLQYRLVEYKDILKYREMLGIAFPFVSKVVSNNLRAWDDHRFENIHERFEKSMNKELFSLRRQFTPQTGLTGIKPITSSFVKNYFEKDYKKHLDRYFGVEYGKEGYPIVLFMGYNHTKRLDDGKPGNTIEENVAFSVVTLFMIYAEQCIHQLCENAQQAFHQATDWPLIYSGPGGGYMINGLKMLSEAGLAPLYSESLFFIETFNVVKEEFLACFNSILNGRYPSIVNKEAYKCFLELISNHNKKIAKKNFVKLLDSTNALIGYFIEHPNMSWYEMIENVYGGLEFEKCF